MMWKIFAAVCASGLIIAGAAALAFAPADSGPSLSNSTTTPDHNHDISNNVEFARLHGWLLKAILLRPRQ